ncbi:MAG: ABC transporter ATP-binding protein [Actinomycetes bacterium]
MSAITVTSLRKSYGPVEAVRGVDLTVRHGEVFALLGPNGAGKTSTMEILEGYHQPTSGQVEVLGLDPGRAGRRLRERIGIVLQETAVDPYLTVREVLRRNAGYYPRPRDVGEVIEVVGLTEKSDARVKTLSGGQQRRLDVALGIIGGPELIFLDEPTTGFDPSARRSAWDLVRGLADGGTTIMLTTHYMDEAAHLADRVAVIAAGRIVAEGSPDTLGGRDQAAVRIGFRLPATTGPDQLPVRATQVDRGEDGSYAVQIGTDDEVRVLHELTGWALASGNQLDALVVERPSLEDVYLALTGGAGSDAEAVPPSASPSAPTPEGAR